MSKYPTEPEKQEKPAEKAAEPSQAETPETTAASAPSETTAPGVNSQDFNEHISLFPILLIVGAVVVIAAYAGLFLLGRKHAKK